MAKGASTEPAMGKLHNQLTALFSKVLESYEDEPDLSNPAMLGAVSSSSRITQSLLNLNS